MNRRGLLAAALVAAVIAGAVAALLAQSGASPAPAPLPTAGVGQLPTSAGAGTPTPPASLSPVHHPNIVFVLTDDLSMDLLRYMPQVQALASRGMTFNDYFVSDSLCCPSRASIFTGNFPHDTHVFTNNGPHGGMGAWYAHGNEINSFNVALQREGYRTAMMGKYINGYLEGPRRSPVPNSYVPPGWNAWDVAGWGYPEFDYKMNINGRVRYFGSQPRAYLTDVLARRGVSFIDRAAAAGQPFFLELATFSPHYPYTPAPRDAGKFPDLHAPRPPSFDRMPTDAPRWLVGHPPLTPTQLEKINRAVRLRAQAVQSVDDMLSRVEQALRRHHLLHNTYIVFSSDNGLHAGEYRMMPGKLTAFDTDIHVPLVVAGPGITPGSSTDAMAENIDLADTFTAMGRTPFASDGHSLMPVLTGATPAGWRNAVLVEHHHPIPSYLDPDLQSQVSGNPPSYEAIRTKSYLYVEYVDGEREFYDLRTDPYELHNVVRQLTTNQRATLHAALTRLENCHTGDACWAAGHIAPVLNLTPTGP